MAPLRERIALPVVPLGVGCRTRRLEDRPSSPRQIDGLSGSAVNWQSRPAADVHERQLYGGLKIIAAIPRRPVIEKILTHLGLQARAPPRAPARGQALQAA
jgi:hypothetical protein